MPRYRMNAALVDAIQWRGDNVDDVGTFLGPDVVWSHVEGNDHIYLEGQGWSIDVVTSDWIVRKPDGTLAPWANENFQTAFHLVPELKSLEIEDDSTDSEGSDATV